MTASNANPGLEFDLQWAEAVAAGSAADATRGRLVVRFGDSILWGQSTDGSPAGIAWTWIDLLEHLSQNWIRIAFEEGDPLGLGVSPKFLRLEAEKRWEGLSGALRDLEEGILFEFEDVHDLSHALQGAWVPPIWVVRSGRQFIIASENLQARTSIDSTIRALSEVGEAICSRIAGLADDRSKLAREAWLRRQEIDPSRFAEMMTGLDGERLRELAGRRDPAEMFELSSNLADNELLAAARMTSTSLGICDIDRILQRVRQLQHRSTSKLDRWAQQLQDHPTLGQPHEVGYWGAARIRELLDVAPTDRFFPDEILHSAGVRVVDVELESAAIDAVACWGPKHGPAILVNKNGVHARGVAGRRFTLAHELCHLLLDREGALPFAEAVGGRAPRETEQRASAFAAELLIPRTLVAAAFDSNSDVDATVESLRRRYLVSPEVVAWQARNAAQPIRPAVRDRLRKHVKDPGRF